MADLEGKRMGQPQQDFRLLETLESRAHAPSPPGPELAQEGGHLASRTQRALTVPPELTHRGRRPRRTDFAKNSQASQIPRAEREKKFYQARRCAKLCEPRVVISWFIDEKTDAQ